MLYNKDITVISGVLPHEMRIHGWILNKDHEKYRDSRCKEVDGWCSVRPSSHFFVLSFNLWMHHRYSSRPHTYEETSQSRLVLSRVTEKKKRLQEIIIQNPKQVYLPVPPPRIIKWEPLLCYRGTYVRTQISQKICDWILSLPPVRRTFPPFIEGSSSYNDMFMYILQKKTEGSSLSVYVVHGLAPWTWICHTFCFLSPRG